MFQHLGIVDKGTSLIWRSLYQLGADDCVTEGEERKVFKLDKVANEADGATSWLSACTLVSLLRLEIIFYVARRPLADQVSK